MLDFKNFKKVAEDDKTATMRHPKGHEIRVILKGLRPIEREQLKRIKMADGGDPADAESTDTDSTPAAAPNASLQSAEPAPINVPQVPSTPPVLNPDGTMNPGATAETGQAGIDLGQKIETESAKAKAQYDQQYLDERQRLNNLDAQHLQEMQAHTKDLSDYMKANPINPDAYGQSQTDTQKIGTGIGLFLGGMGGQGHSNLALDFLNKQIDRNIEAQKENVHNQRTVWGAYHDLYGDENIANNLSKVSANDMLTHQVDLTAAQLGTPQAAQKAMQLRTQKAIENSKLLQESAVSLKALPGYTGSSGPLGENSIPIGNGSMGNMTASNAPVSGEYDKDHLLSPGAKQKYDELKYNHTKTPEQISAIQNQYQAAVQVDKSIDQIKALWPQLRAKANMSDWAASHVDPHVLATLGGAAAGGGTALTGYGLPLAAGAATLGAGAGEAVGHLAKGALSGVAGQQGIQYHTALNTLTTQLGNALGEGITPTEKAQIAAQFAPTWRDDDETANDKLEKLIQKIKTVAKTGALSDLKMTND